MGGGHQSSEDCGDWEVGIRVVRTVGMGEVGIRVVWG